MIKKRVKIFFNSIFFSFSVIIISAILFIGFLPERASAQTSHSEINQQLGNILLVLANLSADLQSGAVSPSVAKIELERLSTVIEAFILLAKANLPPANLTGTGSDPLPGQPLSVFPPETVQLQYPPPLPEAFISISPGSSGGSTVTENFSSNVLSFSIKPFYSDIEVRRVDVTFDKRMWLYAEEISLVSGGVLSRITQPMSPSSFFAAGSDRYVVRFTDFSQKVAKDRSKTFYVKVKAREFIPGETDILVFLNNNSIRAIDQAEFQHTFPGTSGGIDGTFSRKFRVR